MDVFEERAPKKGGGYGEGSVTPGPVFNLDGCGGKVGVDQAETVGGLEVVDKFKERGFGLVLEGASGGS